MAAMRALRSYMLLAAHSAVRASGLRPAMVVEEDAIWPESPEPIRVATVFRVSGTKVTAALRLPDLTSELELARICREMAASE